MFFLVLRPSRDRFKDLLWQGDGFLLLYKRFEKGRLQWPRTPDGVDRMAVQGPVRPQVGNQESCVPGRTAEPVQ